jgi:hypothetical protein
VVLCSAEMKQSTVKWGFSREWKLIWIWCLKAGNLEAWKPSDEIWRGLAHCTSSVFARIFQYSKYD